MYYIYGNDPVEQTLDTIYNRSISLRRDSHIVRRGLVLSSIGINLPYAYSKDLQRGKRDTTHKIDSAKPFRKISE